MRILITGSSGFLGMHLVTHLGKDAANVVRGFGRTERPDSYLGDLDDSKSIENALAEFRPDWLFHLAGYAKTGKSFDEKDKCFADNVGGTENLFRALEATGLKPRVLFASTGLVYGDVAAGMESHDERSELNPASPYAQSKLEAEELCVQRGRELGIEVIRARLFNSIGTGQDAEFAVPRFAKQIAAIEANPLKNPLVHGDLEGYRDFTDVRDTVIALAELMKLREPGPVYNVGSGELCRMKDVLKALLELKKPGSEIRLERDPNLPADTSKSFCNPALLKRATGWAPNYALEQTLAEVLAEWRGK